MATSLPESLLELDERESASWLVHHGRMLSKSLDVSSKTDKYLSWLIHFACGSMSRRVNTGFRILTRYR